MTSESGVWKSSYDAVRSCDVPALSALLAGNGTVPFIMWRGGGMRSFECRLAEIIKPSSRHRIGLLRRHSVNFMT